MKTGILDCRPYPVTALLDRRIRQPNDDHPGIARAGIHLNLDNGSQ
jgi:hypothetical protein